MAPPAQAVVPQFPAIPTPSMLSSTKLNGSISFFFLVNWWHFFWIIILVGHLNNGVKKNNFAGLDDWCTWVFFLEWIISSAAIILHPYHCIMPHYLIAVAINYRWITSPLRSIIAVAGWCLVLYLVNWWTCLDVIPSRTPIQLIFA